MPSTGIKFGAGGGGDSLTRDRIPKRTCEWCKKNPATWFFTRWGGFGLSLCDTCADRCKITVARPAGLVFNGPVYWKYETSGKMKTIVEKFLKEQPFNAWELETFRWYVCQWVASMPSRPPDFNKILRMSQKELYSYIAGELLEYGIDPL